MTRRWLLIAAIPLLAGCGRLDQLMLSPATTADQWCQERPCVTIGDIVVAEPTSTVLVGLLSLLWLAAGLALLLTVRGQRSRCWLGIALVLGGIGAGLAGTSYQALSYELKCAGRATCLLTTGFEVGYSITQAASVSAMLISVAYATTTGRPRRGVIVYAVLSAAAYVVIAALGVWLPSALLLSFEVLMAFAVPGIVLVIVITSGRWRRLREPLDRELLVATLVLVAVQIAYFASYAAGLTEALWARGVWFSANDVLHLGMVAWLCYLIIRVRPLLRDEVGPHAG